MATVGASAAALAGDAGSGATHAAVALTQQAAGLQDETLAAQWRTGPDPAGALLLE